MVGCLVGAGLFSRYRGWSICSIVSVSGSDFRCREGGFRASSAACLGNRSRFILCVSVRSCSFLPACSSRCGGVAGGSFLVPCASSVWRCGGGRGCLLARARGLVGLLCWRCRPSRPVSLLARSLRGRGGVVSGRVSRLACLETRRRRCSAFRACPGCRAIACRLPIRMRLMRLG